MFYTILAVFVLAAVVTWKYINSKGSSTRGSGSGSAIYRESSRRDNDTHTK